MRSANNAAFPAPALPMANVPTGTPAGICTIDERVQPIERLALHRHTQHQASGLSRQSCRAVWAAPPAPATMISGPGSSRRLQHSDIHCGVRCADTTRHSMPR